MLSERRDDWRADFLKRFLPLVKDCKSAGDAAQVLNRGVFKAVNVSYHATKRRKPDQSPYESMQIGYASCSGLSILLVDAFGYGWSELQWFTVNAMKSAFIPFDERLVLINDVIKPAYAKLLG